MKSTKSFATTSLAGTILALMLATGAAPSLSPIGIHVASSYHSAVRAYDTVRRWGVIARWWVDPHNAAAMEMAVGITFPPRRFVGRLFGPLAKKAILTEGKPFRRNSPSDKSLIKKKTQASGAA